METMTDNVVNCLPVNLGKFFSIFKVFYGSLLGFFLKELTDVCKYFLSFSTVKTGLEIIFGHFLN